MLSFNAIEDALLPRLMPESLAAQLLSSLYPEFANDASAHDPVSYTHLDVYKRQLVHPGHEIAAERLLSGHLHTLAVEGSHAFHSSSFAVRERTALANQALLPKAEALGTELALVSGQVFPKARLYVATSDGGKVPLSRLAVAPVHSLLSGHAAELIGAAALCDKDEGQIVIAQAELSLIHI